MNYDIVVKLILRMCEYVCPQAGRALTFFIAKKVSKNARKFQNSLRSDSEIFKLILWLQYHYVVTPPQLDPAPAVQP